jgi:hypothetical protein
MHFSTLSSEAVARLADSQFARRPEHALWTWTDPCCWKPPNTQPLAECKTVSVGPLPSQRAWKASLVRPSREARYDSDSVKGRVQSVAIGRRSPANRCGISCCLVSRGLGTVLPWLWQLQNIQLLVAPTPNKQAFCDNHARNHWRQAAKTKHHARKPGKLRNSAAQHTQRKTAHKKNGKKLQ